MAKQKTILIQPGNVATFVSDAFTSGSYTRLGGGYSPTDFSASSTINIGPFNEARGYSIDYVGTDLSVSQAYSGAVTADDDAEIALKAPIASPTFTGTVVLPSTTSVGDVSSAELQFINGLTSAVQTQIDAKAPNVVVSNVGTAATNVVAVESGDGYQHTVVLTVTNAVLPAIAGGGLLSVGVALYTLPAGACIIDKAYMSLAIQQQDGNITADTPDGGLALLQGTGNQALLSALGAGYEDIITGQTFNDCDGTAEVKTVANQIKVVEVGDPHVVYFNVADSWAASGDTGALVSGTVVLHYQFMN